MNEIRDLIIGIDFGKETAQVFYFDRKAQEPRALSMKAGTNLCEVPVLLLRRGQQGDFLAGLEAESYEKEHGGELITDLYDLTGLEKKEGLPGGLAPWEYAAAFLKGILKYLGVASVPDNTRSLIITVPSLTEARVANLRKACESLGFASGKYALMDHEEAFYYHVMTQQKEPLSRSVGWYEFEGNRVVFRRLEIFRNRKPAMVRFGESKETTLSPDPVMKDSEFAAWAEKTLGQELYTSIQISGEGFSQKQPVCKRSLYGGKGENRGPRSESVPLSGKIQSAVGHRHGDACHGFTRLLSADRERKQLVRGVQKLRTDPGRQEGAGVSFVADRKRREKESRHGASRTSGKTQPYHQAPCRTQLS